MRTRASITFFIFCFIYTLITLNLFIIQVWNSYFFTSMAEQQYAHTTAQLPARAPIIDRTGTNYLATNRECVSAFLIPNQIKNAEKLNQFLQQHFPDAYTRLQAKRAAPFMYIKRNLSDEHIALIDQSELSDIHLLTESRRYYPTPSCCPLIGFTNIDNEGLAGVELQYNKQLQGTPTVYNLEKDARSGYFYFEKQMHEEGQAGTPITITIDSNLQFLTDQLVKKWTEKWNATQGAAVIIDPETGDVLCMSSYPYTTLESADFSIDKTKNMVVHDVYELGSVIKVFAALAALEEKIVTPDEIIDCKNKKTCIIDGRTINTWKPHGAIPFTDVIAFSNNIGIAQIAKRVGPKLYDHYTQLGFGSKTGINLPAEQSGFVNHPTNWSKQSIISLSYGYEISCTLAQLARAFCVIANGGFLIQPRIFAADPIVKSDQPLYSKESIDTIKNILHKTTQYGTAHRATIKGYNMLSKTGTANLLVNGTYDHDQNIFTCATIVEKDTYKRVIVTCIKQANAPNAFASTIAVPLAKAVAEQMIIHERAIA